MASGSNPPFSPWPPPWAGTVFPASIRSTDPNGNKADFPDSGGGREEGKFRPSATPRLTQIAVVNDDGTQIGSALFPSQDEQLQVSYAILYALSLMVNLTVPELMENVADLDL